MAKLSPDIAPSQQKLIPGSHITTPNLYTLQEVVKEVSNNICEDALSKLAEPQKTYATSDLAKAINYALALRNGLGTARTVNDVRKFGLYVERGLASRLVRKHLIPEGAQEADFHYTTAIPNIYARYFNDFELYGGAGAFIITGRAAIRSEILSQFPPRLSLPGRDLTI